MHVGVCKWMLSVTLEAIQRMNRNCVELYLFVMKYHNESLLKVRDVDNDTGDELC